MAWTKEQQLAINTSGTNIIVSAGAGSGKTAVLSTRVIEKLKQGTHINELLILTFTNAAAAEMKERIKKNIKKENLIQELDLLDSAYITTFDSFALSLTKKYHYLLNIPKELTITDSTIINTKKRKILNDIMESYYQEERLDFTEWISVFCQKDDTSFQEEILNLANKLEIKTDLEEFLTTYIDQNYNPEKEESLIATYHQILKELLAELNLEIENNQHYFETDYLHKIYDSINPLLHEEDLNHLIAKILTVKLPMVPRGSEEETKEAKDRINNKLKEVKEACTYGYTDEIKSDYQKSKDYISLTIEILKTYFHNLAKYKRENLIFDFTDIAKLSLTLLKENPDIKEELKQTFKEIMVDEYQDTSDIQEEFIRLISNHNVYMVGDIKQSIYRFRNANPNIFKTKYDAYSKNENGLKIDLLKNFRSRNEVLDNINLIFNKIMDDKIGNADYQNTHQMVFGNTSYNEQGATSQNYQMEILEYKNDDKKYSKDEIEIFTIAQDIKKKVTEKYLVFNRDTLELTPAKYSDFVLILDRNTTFDLTKKIFEYMGIPLSLYKDEDLNSSNDIYIIKNILHFLILIKEKNYSKEYEYCFTSIARSFLYRLTDQEIFDIITTKTIFKSKIYLDFKALAQELNTLSLEEIILKIIDLTSYYEKLITVGNIKESLIRIDKIIQLGKNMNQLNYTIKDFYQYLEELLEKGELIKFSLGTSSSNSVKIMNIHKSKGLEFPICYFCGLSKSFSKEDLKGDFIYEPTLPIYTPIFKEGIKETVLKQIIKNKMMKDDISEKIRLFYVALTRAKEKMILILPKKDDLTERKNSYDVILDPVRLKYKSIADMLYSIPNELNFYKKDVDLETLGLTKDYLLPKKKTRTTENITQKLEVKPLSIPKEELKMNTYSKKMTELIDKETKRNIDFGIEFHKTLQYLDFHHFDEEEIPNQFIRENIKAFLAQPLLKNKKEAKIYQEYEFIYEENESIYHGQIDLMLEYSDHIDIIDYKLNNIIDESYQKQLKGYQNYMQTKTSKKINIYLYSILAKEMKQL